MLLTKEFKVNKSLILNLLLIQTKLLVMKLLLIENTSKKKSKPLKNI